MEELFELLSIEIPEKSNHDDGFLEILGLAHYENINSRIYAYFLDQSRNSKIAQIFLDALMDVVRSKTKKEIAIETFNVETEVVTIKGNRIDIVINDIENESAVIIENKIYHYLHNDLIDYWDHFSYNYENKIGVLLTLEAHNIPENARPWFVNVTHYEWISSVIQKGLPSGLNHKMYIYLNDFINTIDNLTKTIEMNELSKFYFQHTNKVKRAIETQQEAEVFVAQQLEQLAAKLGWETYGKNPNWRNIWDAKNKRQTFYTILLEDVMNGKKELSIVIEIEKDDRSFIPQIEHELSNDPAFNKLDKNSYSAGQFVHFLSKRYSLQLNELENLSDFLLEKIKTDFEEVMGKILLITDKTNH